MWTLPHLSPSLVTFEIVHLLGPEIRLEFTGQIAKFGYVTLKVVSKCTAINQGCMQFTAKMKFKYTSVMEFSSAEGGSSVQKDEFSMVDDWV
jgi:hypothetical protein